MERGPSSEGRSRLDALVERRKAHGCPSCGACGIEDQPVIVITRRVGESIIAGALSDPIAVVRVCGITADHVELATTPPARLHRCAEGQELTIGDAENPILIRVASIKLDRVRLACEARSSVEFHRGRP